MESRIITPGPYRATKLWNELTKLFRAGMPLKKHRMHLKKYTNCFMASEAVDWLHELLRSNSNFGPEVTRQQTLQLLRKFLKNHVIEDIKGRWGAENLDDNSQLYRFPTTSPLKVVPNHPPFHKTNAASRSTKVKGGFCELPKTMTKENDILQFQVNAEETDKEMPEVISEEPKIHVRQVTQTDIEETWREVALNHLQKILGLAALNDVLDFSQVIPQYILYNVHNVSKHGVVILQDKSEDLPHWVLSAMKCLANWPRNNDLTQPSYPGFERDVFKTVADYFMNLPEPLLTFEFYELFVNILVLCGYIMVSNRSQGKRKNLDELYCPQPAKSQHLNRHTHSFKSTECLLLSLIRKDVSEENNPLFQPEQLQEEMEYTSEQNINQKGCVRHLNQNVKNYGKAVFKEHLTGGSCQNLTNLKNDHIPHSSIQSSCYSVGNVLNFSSGDILHKQHCHSDLNEAKLQNSHKQSHSQVSRSLTKSRPRAESMSNLYLESGRQQISNSTSRCSSAWTLTESGKEPWTNCTNQELLRESSNVSSQNPIYGQDQRNQNVQSWSLHHFSKMNSSELNTASKNKIFNNKGSHFNINAPAAEVTMKPDFSAPLGFRRPSLFSLAAAVGSEYPAIDGALVSHYNKHAVDGSEHASTGCHSTFAGYLNGTQSLLQPQLERIAIEALQICCLFLPPPNRRKLQLLMRMISRISQNVDMPQLHEAMGTRMLVVQTFSRCILRCENEADLDELLGTRLVSFILDHHQEILQVPPYLQNAVDNHIRLLQKVQITYPCTNMNAEVPMYTFCKQISTKEFEEQKVSVSQIAIAELLENIVEDKKMSIKDKRKKLKQFQREYPEMYQNRFPTTDSEAKLFQDKPKIKQPMLITMKRPLKSLQKMQRLRY
ncbi:DEP domain-containing protein 1B-like isoform X1 [Chiloscyllium plagiosum]|uniref:DEP domain-containing protein 1B-like isoform X1 n=1 Tax=Chiloscyllium plagiosum TaxID=36176 RepID=UPI001CB7E5C0|nr:DEP domain-containing protein 1B-like isoform X1 [Chiloscyllium plagiosum]